MNKTAGEAAEFVEAPKARVSDANSEVVVRVPFVCLPGAIEASKGSNVKVAAQNMHWEEKGALRGDFHAMLSELMQIMSLLGTERRQYFGETDQTVNKKVHAAFKYGLKPIVCVGESLTQRNRGNGRACKVPGKDCLARTLT